MKLVFTRLAAASVLCFVLETAAADLPFFDQTPGVIEIQLPSEAVRSLRVNPRKDVSAEIKAGRRMWREVAVRLKGSGTFQPVDEKPSLTLTFPDGKIHLNNSLDDPSRLNEFVGASLSKRAGLEVPRVGHAVVHLNGRRLGLYVVKEGFASPPVELDENATPGWEDLNRLVDVNAFSAFMAFEVMTCHWDGYSLRRNNFHAFRDSTSGKVAFRPSGMDQLFGKADLTWKPAMTGPLAQAMMAVPQGQVLYEQQFRKLFASIFDSRAIKEAIDGRVQELKPILARGEFATLKAEAAELCARIVQRETYLKKQFANEEAARSKTYDRTGMRVAEKLLMLQD